MKKTAYIVAFLLCLNTLASCQSSNATKRFRKAFIENENSGVSRSPITNREYIIYLCWNISVYGASFPDKVISLLPQESVPANTPAITGYESILIHSGPIFRDYILNPRYLDFPLTGLDLNQVMALEKWLSDRYNEYITIQLGYLNFTPDQKDSDCFVLESYLVGQFTGSTKNDKIIRWNDGHFLPTFRLPEQGELNWLHLNINDQNIIKPYTFKASHFLSPWNNIYLKADFNSITIQVGNLLNFQLQDNLNIEISNFIDIQNPEATLADKEKLYIHRKYFEDAGYKEKDETGIMDFVVIGENSFKRAIIATYQKQGNKQETINKIYRIAYDKIIEFKYWP
ncbi:MAG TPA: hypothetical protein VFG10_02785 [Saprospiraceae bacterium]|nr:hypothetical protein [Saprospiraceae bacterium]